MQFLFNSELSGTLDEARIFLAAKNIGGAKEKLADFVKSLRRRQKISNLPTKVKLRLACGQRVSGKELARDSEDEKRIRKAQ